MTQQMVSKGEEADSDEPAGGARLRRQRISKLGVAESCKTQKKHDNLLICYSIAFILLVLETATCQPPLDS